MEQATSSISHINLSIDQLIKLALARKEAVMATNGALCVETGKRTGRSPKDRFIVKDALTTDSVEWGAVNQPFSTDQFNELWQKAKDYLADREVFISHLHVGADAEHHLPVKVITETAWHNLFAHNLFIDERDPTYPNKPEWTIMSAPGLITDPATDGTTGDGVVVINLSDRKVLLIGMRYAGEMKKAMFTSLNFILPENDVLPMHCAANVGEEGVVFLFFGL